MRGEAEDLFFEASVSARISHLIAYWAQVSHTQS